MLESITDGTGRPLLSVGLSNVPSDGDCIMLAKKGNQEIGYCEITGAGEGWSAKIFRWNGELFAHLREAHADDLRRLAETESTSQSTGQPGSTAYHQKTFIVHSAHGPAWELRVKGNFQEWNVFVEDSLRQVKAMVSPGPNPLSPESRNGYRLRLGPRADSCTVIMALLTIERILIRKGHLPTRLQRSVTARDFAPV